MGVVGRKQIIDGTQVALDDAVVGIASNGLHSNGFSLARRALLDGDDALPLDHPVDYRVQAFGSEVSAYSSIATIQ